MSQVLLLRLAGPMQSWGTQSRFSHRDTGREPSKSGVLGLLGAALGMPREDEATLARLSALRMGVRVDLEGRWLADYHTTGGGQVPGRPYGVANSRGGRGGTVVSVRDYLADADFLVGLAGDDEELLTAAATALANPVWPLYLGRRGFPPASPPFLGLYAGPLERLLAQWPWTPPRNSGRTAGNGPRLVIETSSAQGEVRYDNPVSFARKARSYRVRRVLTSYVIPTALAGEEEW